ncbi:HEAT repeat domain-containing protein [Armatimonas sp.]|uniref:HEAT repeat domain-containing protein n=1 Tax=Armatimonas sp. TaxID=1872638 RepID=UPI003751F014
MLPITTAELLTILHRDSYGDRAWLAAVTLGAMGDSEAIPVLVMLTEKNHYAARALCLMGDEGIEALLAKVSIVAAVDGFLRFPHPRAAELLDKGLLHQHFHGSDVAGRNQQMVKQLGAFVFPYLLELIKKKPDKTTEICNVIRSLQQAVPMPWTAEVWEPIYRYLSQGDWVTLAEFGEQRAAAPLRDALKNALETKKKPDMLWLAAIGLGQLRDRSAIPLLVSALETKDLQLITSSIWALGEIGEPDTLPVLQEMLRKWTRGERPFHSKSRETRVNARVELALALTKLKAPEALELMLGCVGYYDPYDWGVSATPGFVLLGEEVIPPLHAALKSKRPRVVIGAIHALASRNELIPLPLLMPLLLFRHSPTEWGWEEAVRSEAAAALGKTGRLEALEGLIGLLDDTRYDISVSVRQALVTLALNVPEAVGILATQIAGQQSWTLDHTVLEGLAKVGDRALVSLREQLKASEARTREAAALALGWLNDQEARGLLGELSLSDSTPEVREAAAIAATYLRVVKPGFRPTSFSPY